MTHDEQWKIIIDDLKVLVLTVTPHRECRRKLAQLNEAAKAQKAGENPLLWKLANG